MLGTIRLAVAAGLLLVGCGSTTTSTTVVERVQTVTTTSTVTTSVTPTQSRATTPAGDLTKCGRIRLGPPASPPFNVLDITSSGTSCAEAIQIMTLLLRGEGQVHTDGSLSERYVIVNGWTCFGPHTGTAYCDKPNRAINAAGIG